MSSSSAEDTGGGGGDAAARVTIICSVCTDPLVEDGLVQVATPCGHVFHKHCLVDWYTSKNKKKEKRSRSQGQFCCPYCGQTTKSDSDCKFRLYFNTEEDSDYLAMFQKVTQLRREKDEITERLGLENAKALERLNQEQMEAVDCLRLEHFGKVERLQQEHARQIKRFQNELIETMDILFKEKAKTKTMEGTIQRLIRENAQTLERMRQEQVATVNRIRVENSEETERLRHEHTEQIKGLRQMQVATVDCLRLKHSDEKGLLRQLIQFQKDEIQSQKDEIQLLKAEIQFLIKPIHLLQIRVKTLASEKLQRGMDELEEKFKRLVEAAGSNSDGGEYSDRAEVPGFVNHGVGSEVNGGGVTAVLQQGHHPSFPKKRTENVTNAINPSGGQVQVQAFSGGYAATAGPVVQGTSSSTSSVLTNVTNTLSQRPELEIILEKQKPNNVPKTSTTLPQQRSSSEKREVSAAEGSEVSSKKQKIDDNTKMYRPIKFKVQLDMTKQPN